MSPMLTYGAGRMPPGVGTGLIPTKTPKALLESLFRDPLFYSNKPEETFSTSQPPGEGACGDKKFSCGLTSDFYKDPATECKLGSLSSPMNVASSVYIPS